MKPGYLALPAAAAAILALAGCGSPHAVTAARHRPAIVEGGTYSPVPGAPAYSPAAGVTVTPAPSATPVPSETAEIADTPADVAACQQWEAEQDGLQSAAAFMVWMDENSGTGDGVTSSTGMDSTLITQAAQWFVDSGDPSDAAIADVDQLEIGVECLSIGA